MLKPAADAAECFLADAQVRSNKTKRNPFNNMRRLLYQFFVTFFGSFKLCIYISFFQPDIIFFVGNANQPFYIVMLVEQLCQRFFCNGPKGAAFNQLNIFYSRFAGNKTVKRSNEIFFKTKPMRYFFFIQIIKSTQCTFLQEIQMPAHIALCKQEFIFIHRNFCKAVLQSIFSFGAQPVIGSYV